MVSISNSGQAPSEWELAWLETGENPYGLIVSEGVVLEGEHVYVYAAKEPEHTIHLVRWPVAEMLEEDLSQPQWWVGEDEGWVVEQNLEGALQALFVEGHTEFMEHEEPLRNRFVEVETVRFCQAELGFRLAERLAGRWSPLERFYPP